MIETIKQFSEQAPLYIVGLMVFAGFSFIYFFYAMVSYYFTRYLLPKYNIGALIENRPLTKGQVWREILYSLGSILIFASFSMVAVLAMRSGFITINWSPTLWLVLFNIALVIIWNEIYFYMGHRLLHTKWLYKHVHDLHHRSVTPTPFSTYCFHPVEAAYVSAVMFLVMPFHQLDIITIIIYPMISLLANSIGHMNYAIFPSKSLDNILAGAQRHTAHHTRWQGNFGFYFPWMDQLFNTQIEPREKRKS